MAEQSAATDVAPTIDQFESIAPSEEISRPTEELVIGMVGAVGAGVSKTALELKRILERDYDYKVDIVKASDTIRRNADKTSNKNPATHGSQRIAQLQAIGTELREKFGEDYIAAKVVEGIAIQRKVGGGYDESTRVPQPKAFRI